MPNYNGDLIERDTLRLLAVLRYVRKFVSDETAHVVATEYEVAGVKVQVTFGGFLDEVLKEYREYET